MAAFRFNFSGGDSNMDNLQKVRREEAVHWLDCEEVELDNQIQDLEVIASRAKMFTCGEVEIGHVVAKEALLSLADRGLNAELAEKGHSDLIPGKYEGGLKIWECTHDLIEYLTENGNDIKWPDSNVLDLGCGVGILGIYAFMKGARVTLQDYNKEVLQCVTIPNVLLNIEEEENRETEVKRCKFYSGDWGLFNKKLPDSTLFDVILSSETVYNTSNYDKLINLFLNRLSKSGVIYLAAKTHYFGVGGGTRQFEEALEKNGLLKSEKCWKSTGGIQREILKIKWK